MNDGSDWYRRPKDGCYTVWVGGIPNAWEADQFYDCYKRFGEIVDWHLNPPAGESSDDLWGKVGYKHWGGALLAIERTNGLDILWPPHARTRHKLSAKHYDHGMSVVKAWEKLDAQTQAYQMHMFDTYGCTGIQGKASKGKGYAWAKAQESQALYKGKGKPGPHFS